MGAPLVTQSPMSWRQAKIESLNQHGMPYAGYRGELRYRRGEVIDLGYGIAPRSGWFGARPLFWYVAMGYLSGIPLRYVFAWVW